MTEVTILPETKSSMTETQIGYSIKIAEQTIKNQLNEQLKNKNEIVKELRKKARVKDGRLKEKFSELIEEDSAIYFNQDSAMYCLVEAFNYMNDDVDEHVEQVWDLVIEARTEHIVQRATSFDPFFISDLEKVVETGMISVEYKMAMGFLDKRNVRDVRNYGEGEYYNLVSFDIHCPAMLLSHIEDVLPLLKEYDLLKAEIVDISERLNDVPSTLKKVESQLLIQELSNTEEGKAVLGVTGDIINDVVGSQVMLEAKS